MSNAIESTMVESRVFPPPAKATEGAAIAGMDAYKALCKQAADDPDAGDVDDGIVGNDGFGLGVDADRTGVRVDGRGRVDVAHDIARAGGDLPAGVEIGDVDPGGGAINDVVGDHRAGESEFGEDGDLAGVAARIAAHLRVTCRVDAHGGEGAVGNDIVRDDDAIGLEDVDAVAVLAVAAAAPVDRVDHVARNDRAIMARCVAPDADAGIAAAGNAVAADEEAAAVGTVDGGVAQFGEA